MKPGSILLLALIVIVLAWSRPLHAQWGYDEDCGNDCSLNTNIAMVVNMPAGPTAQVAATGWGTVAGVGWNINKRSALIGEFMWNRMYANSAAIQTILSAVPQPTGNLNGSANLFAVTGNYRFELRGRWVGGYVTGGGGWYLRNTNLSQSVTVGSAVVCTPAWRWWGFNCSSGTVTASQTIAGSNSNVLGGNAGAGVTVRVGTAPYRLYAEARYNYAPTKNISTQFVAMSFGIRY